MFRSNELNVSLTALMALVADLVGDIVEEWKLKDLPRLQAKTRRSWKEARASESLHLLWYFDYPSGFPGVSLEVRDNPAARTFAIGRQPPLTVLFDQTMYLHVLPCTFMYFHVRSNHVPVSPCRDGGAEGRPGPLAVAPAQAV